MVLNLRYRLTKLLGDGTFGRVVLAKDMQSGGRDVAIKIIRDVKRYKENAWIEADILKDIGKADPNGTSGCALMCDTFTHVNKFFCLVFEPLGVSLYDFLKNNDFRGFWMQDIQSFAKQSMQALMFLHQRLRMTHTDLKPENILLCSMEQPRVERFPREAEWLKTRAGQEHTGQQPYMRPVNSSIKLIDFGNATYFNEKHSSIINTRQYRGPEVLLSTGWNELSDQWSIGCILMELYSGEQLFETHEELEHLALMERIIGQIPQALLANSSKHVKQKYLVYSETSRTWRIRWPDGSSSPSSEQHVGSQRPLREQALPHHSSFTSFVGALLALEPCHRTSAADACQHPFLARSFQD